MAVRRFWRMPSWGKAPVPCEYAKYKNRHYIFTSGDMICRLYGVLRAAETLPGNLAMTDDPSPPAPAQSPPERKPLTPEARRALAEAEARRAAVAKANAQPEPKEFQGPKGPEPTRYGDWENKGIASDF